MGAEKISKSPPAQRILRPNSLQAIPCLRFRITVMAVARVATWPREAITILVARKSGALAVSDISCIADAWISETLLK